MPLGRIATRSARYLMGKHKPTYDPLKTTEISDKIVIVNAGDIYVTGRTRYRKIFRHHTQYAGGLKEILFIDLMRKDPEQLIKRVVKGMLPPTKQRNKLLENIKGKFMIFY